MAQILNSKFARTLGDFMPHLIARVCSAFTSLENFPYSIVEFVLNPSLVTALPICSLDFTTVISVQGKCSRVTQLVIFDFKNYFSSAEGITAVINRLVN